MKTKLAALAATLFLAACGSPDPEVEATAGVDVDALANEYLFLELSMGQHDKGHVDAYFGPEAFRETAAAEAMSLDDIRLAASDLSGRLAEIDTGQDAMLAARVRIGNVDDAATFSRGHVHGSYHGVTPIPGRETHDALPEAGPNAQIIGLRDTQETTCTGVERDT